MLSEDEEARIARLMMSDGDLGDDNGEGSNNEEVQDALDMLDSLLADGDHDDGGSSNKPQSKDKVDEKDIEFSPPESQPPVTQAENAGAASDEDDDDDADTVETNNLSSTGTSSPSREINFSPGASGMQTAEAPLEGSFDTTSDNNNTALKSASTHSSTTKEVNFSPTAGNQMETSGAPRQASFRVKIPAAGRHAPKVPIDEAYVDEVTMQDVDQGKWKSDKEAIRTEKESSKPTPKISNRHKIDDDRKTKLQLHTGVPAVVEGDGDNDGTMLDTPASDSTSPSGSSYVGDVDETRQSKQERTEDINFQPEGFLSVTEPTSPKQGSFPAARCEGEATGSGTTAGVVTPPRSSNTTTREINFSPGASDIQPSEMPKDGTFKSSSPSPPTKSPTAAIIPLASFEKMGAMMHGEAVSETQNDEIENECDENDDLLDAMLGDSDPVMTGIPTDEEFVPSGDLQELEKSLDEGLEEVMGTDEAKDEEPLEVAGNDSMTRELDDLLDDENVEEEIEFNFTSPPSSDAVQESAPEKTEPSRKRNTGVAKMFRPKKAGSKQQTNIRLPDEKSKRKSSIATRTVKGIANRTGLRSSTSTNKDTSKKSESLSVDTKSSKSTQRSYFGTRSIARSFMAATKSSAHKFGKKTGDVHATKNQRQKRHERRNWTSGKGSYMASTFTFTRTVAETEMIEAERRKKREEEARKTVVNLKPWGIDRKPPPVLSFDDDEIHSPSRVHNLSIGGSPSRTESSPQRRRNKPVFSPRSVGSLSSQCTVTSFVSPIKEGIRGCQNQYDPYLHEVKGPCELCVFRLDDEEKTQLDIKGRHFKVMFTTGGCNDCKEFSRSFDEAPVRLCVKCWSTAHRPVKVRTPGKGNLPGYSFSKNELVY
mmetsp:Transcript_7614/g.18788  ORF Transcript_7614/g.18788 Transcript_7614/m.18788 type:complete len:878 (-) Transcript_7614:2024-4657(-)